MLDTVGPVATHAIGDHCGAASTTSRSTGTTSEGSSPGTISCFGTELTPRTELSFVVKSGIKTDYAQVAQCRKSVTCPLFGRAADVKLCASKVRILSLGTKLR